MGARDWALPTTTALQEKQRMNVVSVRENERLRQYTGDRKTLCKDHNLRVRSCIRHQERNLTRDCHDPHSVATASGPHGDVEGLV